MWPPSDLESLRAQVRQIEGQHRRATPSLPFGVAMMDARLPGGALPLGALHEIAGGGNGAIDGAAAALFAAGIAARTRGKVLELPDGGRGFITIHPSLLLRIPDARSKAAELRRFTRDLSEAWRIVSQE